ncbi:hypothetical protein N7492_009344 [Penicillium capsulatum]|uniref:Uncharacterized protein n=1 Tax=Penicillium capsulatum TaxID=69766 RepID=A0A9W9HSC3_9EURO|nr:hypothetical protein N7492_009344 [Penicillium capsulatum]KAJ6106737.1 hypothetical protein N7512_010254 [Penicillium capsulatum]
MASVSPVSSKDGGQRSELRVGCRGVGVKGGYISGVGGFILIVVILASYPLISQWIRVWWREAGQERGEGQWRADAMTSSVTPGASGVGVDPIHFGKRRFSKESDGPITGWRSTPLSSGTFVRVACDQTVFRFTGDLDSLDSLVFA